MRYNSESLEIKVVISENGLLFKDIRISLGLFNYCTKNARSIWGKSLPRGVNNCNQSNKSLLSNPKFEANLSA